MVRSHTTPGRAAPRTEILFGVHSVMEALAAARRRFHAIYVAKARMRSAPERLRRLNAAAESLKIPVRPVSYSRLESLAGTDGHQGLAAEVGPYPVASVSDLVGRGKPEPDHRLLVLLDHVVDPQNLGALVRSAHCAGADGCIIPKDRSAPPTPVVSKVSAGALEHILLARVTNMVHTIRMLKKEGIWIVGLDREGDTSIFSADFPPSVAIVIGGEQAGLRQLVRKHCDLLCAIPQKGKIDSLNASVAGGIAMYEVFRQRLARTLEGLRAERVGTRRDDSKRYTPDVEGA